MYTKDEAQERLREQLHPGDTVRTILRHVSASGMTRWISLIFIGEHGEVSDLSWLAAQAMGDKVNTGNHEGIKVGGCGMDMGFHLVYSLSRTLWPEGYECVGVETRCPANDHANERTPEYGPGVMHRDGGYALKHRWL